MDDRSPFDQALTDQSAWVVRAQSPGSPVVSGPLVGPPSGVTTYYPPAYPSSGAAGYSGADAFTDPSTPGYPAPLQDPWASGSAPGYAVPAPGQGFYTQGINGPQPVRFGWQSRYDFTFIPTQGTSNPNVGDIGIFGIDIEKIYTKPTGYNWLWSIGPQFNYRAWNGPDANPPTADLPGGAYRFGLDMVLRSPTTGGWTYELGFNPAIATDFRDNLSSNAWLFDAHAVAFWQMTPKWMWAIGAIYWDRVNDIVIPYAGAVWTPNDIWEFRLVFPKPRISVFLGTPWGIPTWLYAAGEYHVEAYQVKPRQFATNTRVQFADWRTTGGFRWETGWLTSFIEAGYIFGRQVTYEGPAFTDYDINSGFIARAGFRY